MEYLMLGVRIVLAVMFLSSAVSKLRDLPKHFAILEDYRLLPAALVRPFGAAEITAEAGVGVLLLLGLWQPIAAWATLGLLLLYTAAVTINLLRGRTEISCGCGGVAGNHQLSWKLVVRNLILMLSAYGLTLSAGTAALGRLDNLLRGASFSAAFGWAFWITLLVSLAVLLGGLALGQLLRVRGRFRLLLGG